jgi:hypothetical protein
MRFTIFNLQRRRNPERAFNPLRSSSYTDVIYAIGDTFRYDSEVSAFSKVGKLLTESIVTTILLPEIPLIVPRRIGD